MGDEKPAKTVTIDYSEGIKVNQRDYSNEIVQLRTLGNGLRHLSSTIKGREVGFAKEYGDKFEHMLIYGATSEGEREFLEIVACIFHWFGISVCNYVRLVGFIRGLAMGEFVRADLKDQNSFKGVKDSINAYVKSVAEIEAVRIWRNKVFAHFAITDPSRDDNIATLNMSTIFPIAFVDGTFVVGDMTMTLKGRSGMYVSELPRWSHTEVFESLIPRYWHGLSFKAPSAPQEEPDES